MTCVLIVGGSGQFGHRLASRLARTTDFKIIVAGRHPDRTRATATELSSISSAPVEATLLNSLTVTSSDLAELSPDIVINASGPFQNDNYALVEASIKAGSHYVDLADARRFVVGISQYDDQAKDAGVLVVSGASTVPGLSSVVLSHLSKDLPHLDSVEISLSPGNHFDPGLATTRSVLMGLGQPITTQHNGKEEEIYGWQDLRRKKFGTLGKRWLSNVDVPDLALIPDHYPEVATVTFQAGAELSIQHLGLWALSWLSRARLLKRPERLAPTLLKLKSYTQSFGSDCGGMRIAVIGKDNSGRKIEKLWTLVARDAHGPDIPTLASIILVKSLAGGRQEKTGAMPCFDLFSYEAFRQEIEDLSITCTIDQVMR